MTGTTHLLQRHPQTTPTPGLTMTGHPWTISLHEHGLNDLLWKLSSSCGYQPNRLSCLFLQLCIVDQCNVFELLDDMLGILCMYLINLMMKHD
jgi:hypothetical protein